MTPPDLITMSQEQWNRAEEAARVSFLPSHAIDCHELLGHLWREVAFQAAARRDDSRRYAALREQVKKLLDGDGYCKVCQENAGAPHCTPACRELAVTVRSPEGE